MQAKWRNELLSEITFLLAIMAVLSSCATHRQAVDQHLLMPGAGPAYEMMDTQFFVMPIGLETPSPEFPAAADPKGNYDVTVCAELWLTPDGDVDKVMPYNGSPECAGASPQAAPFLDSVLQRLHSWQFTPATICEIPPALAATRAKGDCTGPEVKLQRVPVRLDYAFTFSSHDGKRRVGTSQKSAQPAHE